jgi:hypothetical protein
MMRLVILCLALMVATSAARADLPYPHGAFTATFDTDSTAAGIGAARHISDGQGRLRIEISRSGNSQIGIVDYVKGVTTEIVPSKQIAVTTPVVPHQSMSEESVKHDGTPIGEKVVYGHPCHGYQRRQGQFTSDIWIGDDTHYMVRADTYFQQDRSIFSLRDWSDEPPSPELFQIPQNYRVINLPPPKGQPGM